MAAGKFVAYYRVSTRRQGRSGLGLEAQQESVRSYLNGGRWRLVAEHTEVESGKVNNRPELNAALAACRVHGATLVVAKLDRLSRDAAFLLTLRDAGVDFIAVDMPEANRMTVGMMAVIAENEREVISSRTKAALAAAKRRGVILGNPQNLSDKARRKGTKASAAARGATAEQRAKDLASIILPLKSRGESLRAIVKDLEAQDIPTPRGGSWTPMGVSRLIQRIEGAHV